MATKDVIMQLQPVFSSKNTSNQNVIGFYISMDAQTRHLAAMPGQTDVTWKMSIPNSFPFTFTHSQFTLHFNAGVNEGGGNRQPNPFDPDLVEGIQISSLDETLTKKSTLVASGPGPVKRAKGKAPGAVYAPYYVEFKCGPWELGQGYTTNLDKGSLFIDEDPEMLVDEC